MSMRVDHHRTAQHRQQAGQGRRPVVLEDITGEDERSHPREQQAGQPDEIEPRRVVLDDRRDKQVDKRLHVQRGEVPDRRPGRVLQVGTDKRRFPLDQALLVPSHDPEMLERIAR